MADILVSFSTAVVERMKKNARRKMETHNNDKSQNAPSPFQFLQVEVCRNKETALWSVSNKRRSALRGN